MKTRESKKSQDNQIFSLLSLFLKNKSRFMSLYETWYVYHGTCAHLNGVLRKSLSSICMSIRITSYRC
jgi:hypothetical protein